MGDSMIDVQLQWLARGPSATIIQYQGYEINGYTFYTRAQDEKSTDQNSGVRTDAIGNDGKKTHLLLCHRGDMRTRLWAFEDSFVSAPMGDSSWRRRNDRPVWDDNSGLQKKLDIKTNYSSSPRM